MEITINLSSTEPGFEPLKWQLPPYCDGDLVLLPKQELDQMIRRAEHQRMGFLRLLEEYEWLINRMKYHRNKKSRQEDIEQLIAYSEAPQPVPNKPASTEVPDPETTNPSSTEAPEPDSNSPTPDPTRNNHTNNTTADDDAIIKTNVMKNNVVTSDVDDNSINLDESVGEIPEVTGIEMPLSKSKKRRLRKKRQMAQIKLKKLEKQAKKSEQEALNQTKTETDETISLETIQIRNDEEETRNSDVTSLENVHVNKDRTEDSRTVRKMAETNATTEVIEDGTSSWKGVVLNILLFILLFYQLYFTV